MINHQHTCGDNVKTPIVKPFVKVNANGKRYFLLMVTGGKVYCKGEVKTVSGFSATFGPDKTFLENKVERIALELTESLLEELRKQGNPDEKPVKKIVYMEGNRSRRKWMKLDKYTHRLELTSHAKTQLFREGYSCALDGLGNYLDRGLLESAAIDSAADHDELTRDGAPTGYNIYREIAADYIFDGMMKAYKEKIAKGESVEMPRQYA